MTQFEALGLSPKILKSVRALGFENPTPIQSEAIPLVLAGHDLMGLAQTGTGKTAAFGLPLIHKLLADDTKLAPRAARALILAPTRELAGQIVDNLRAFINHLPLRVALVVGGTSINMQVKKLERGTDILVATPGRLLDLVERRAVSLDTANFLVLDEADQMLDLGFIHALRKIAKLLGKPRQTLLFSATMPKQIEELSRAYLDDPLRIEVSPPGQPVEKIRQSVHFVSAASKVELLRQCLAERPDDLSLVFARTKRGAEKLMKSLTQYGFSASSIHGNKSQGQRDRAIKAFRGGEIRVLVATDVAARGIDIPSVSHVYNYDLPEVPENYVHRIGRTGRAGADGEAVAFCAPADAKLLRDIERLIGIRIPISSGEAGNYEAAPEAKRSRPRGGKPQSRNGHNKQPRSGANGEGQAASSSTSAKRHRGQGPAKDMAAANGGFGASDRSRQGKWRRAKPRTVAA